MTSESSLIRNRSGGKMGGDFDPRLDRVSEFVWEPAAAAASSLSVLWSCCWIPPLACSIEDYGRLARDLQVVGANDRKLSILYR